MSILTPRCLLVITISLICSVASTSLAQKYNAPINRDVAELLRGKKYAEAESMLLKSGKVDPFMLAWLKLKQGKKEEGLAILKKQVSETKEDDRVKLIIRSLLVISEVSVDDAIDVGNFYLKSIHFRDDPKLKFYVSALYLKQKKVAPAKALVDEVLATSFSGPELRRGLLELIVFFYANQRPTDALAYFDKLLTKVPETKLDPGDQLLWARIAAAAGRPLDALKRIDIVQSTYPSYYETKKGRFYLDRAISYDKLGEKGQAKKEFLALVALAKEDPKYEGMAGMAKIKLEEYEQYDKTVKEMKKVRAEAAVPTGAVPWNIRSGASNGRNITTLVVSSVLLAICVTALIWRRFRR